MPKNTGLFPGGTTSAHAENTPGAHGRATHARNYLRMRGEYCAAAFGEYAGMELPPHTRRIQEYAILEEVKLVLFLLISNEVDHYVHP